MVLECWAALYLVAAPGPSFERAFRHGDARSVAFSGSARRAAILLADGIVHLYERRHGLWAHFSSTATHGSITGLTWSWDGSTLAWIGADQNAAVWRLDRREPSEFHVPSRNGDLVDLQLSTDGAWFASSGGSCVSWGRTLLLKPARRISTNSASPSIVFVGKADLVVGAGALTRYSVRSGGCRVIARETGYVEAFAFDAVHRRLAALTFGGAIVVRSIASGRVERRIQVGPGYPVSLAWDSDGRYLVCELCANHKVSDPEWYTRLQVFDYATSRRIAQLPLKDADIGEICLIPGTSRALILSNDGYRGAWDFRADHVYQRH